MQKALTNYDIVNQLYDAVESSSKLKKWGLGSYGLGAALLTPLVAAVLLLIFTRGRLSYKPDRVENEIEASRATETSLT